VRQGRQLLDLDVADDMRLLEYMFACIRAGRIDEVRTALSAALIEIILQLSLPPRLVNEYQLRLGRQ